MRPSINDDEQTEKTDFFDPFWMLFSDEDGGDFGPAKVNLEQSRVYDEDNTTIGMFDYFMTDAEDDSLLGRSEEREPRENFKKHQKQKKQHYWRRNQPKKGGEQRRSFGRKTGSKRNLLSSSNISVESSIRSETRDLPDRSVAESLERTVESTADSPELFPKHAMPNFMQTFTSGWDPWGEQDSSSDSSEGSYTYASNIDDESVASGSINCREPQEVQQILVQFNPGPGSKRSTAETVTFQPSPPQDFVKKLSPRDLEEHNSLVQPGPSLDTAFANDESTIGSYEKLEHSEVIRPQLEFAVTEDKEPSKCLDINKMCGVGKKKELHQRFPFGRSKSSGNPIDQIDLSTVFPKLRMVADEKDCDGKTAVVATSQNFKGNIPAHLQLSSEAFLATKGPQSLYEYEYDGGEHIDVAYNHFGPNPLSLIVIRHHLTPPRPRSLGSIVQVEASTISMTDCSMRSGEWMGKDTPPLPITPGVDMVGKIFRIDNEMSSMLDLCIGHRVISLTRCGGNSRFLSIDPRQLIKISEDVDPAEAACLAETYLSAFQVLHFGQSAGVRYKSNALKGKSILILGTVATTLGHALVELASLAGVAKIIATATAKHFPHLRSLGIIPVSVDPTLWYDQLNGEIDLVIVSNANEDIVAEHFKVLNGRGHLIVVGQRLGSGMPIGDWEGELKPKSLVCKRQKSKVSMIDRTHDYNPFRQWGQDLDKCKKDLSHLVKLLERRAIKPNVLDRIPLNKVAKAQDMVESQRHPSGFLVCEPWLRNKKRAVRL